MSHLNTDKYKLTELIAHLAALRREVTKLEKDPTLSHTTEKHVNDVVEIIENMYTVIFKN